MIKLRHQQPALWHSGLAEDIEDLWEPWMRLVDGVLEDEPQLDTIYETQGERCAQSRSRDDDDPREGHHVVGSTARARHRLRQELGTNVGTVVCR
jgi:hypothetical protein